MILDGRNIFLPRFPGYTAAIIAAFALGFLLPSCWGRDETPTPNPPAEITAKIPASTVATPVTTAPQPALTGDGTEPTSPEDRSKFVSLAEITGKANPLSLENMERVHVGMTFEQVNRSLGKDGIMSSSGDVANEIYRWSDESGASFVGKFEDGKLVRKSAISPSGHEATEITENNESGMLNEELYAQVQPGMSVEEVQALLNVESRILSGTNAKVSMYEWMDAKGSNFYARFEDGRMTRKTGFHVEPLREEKKETLGETVAEEKVETPHTAPTENYEEELPLLAENSPEANPLLESAESPVPRPKVAIVGGSTEKSGRRTRPRVKFPDYTWQFRRGNYEVRVKNTADTEVKVGLRSGKYGKDMDIQPGKSESVDVDQGSYTLYFQYGDDPESVHTGNVFTIDGMQVTDVEVNVFNEDYDIGILNRAND